MDANDVKVSMPNDPRAVPLIADKPITKPSGGPNPVAIFIGWVLKLCLGWPLLFTFECIAFIITFQWVKAIAYLFSGKMRSVPVNDEPSHRWNVIAAKSGLASTPFEGVNTIYGLSKRAFSLHADTLCMGTREFKGQYDAKRKVRI